VGRWIGKARSMADQFRKSFDDMARQSELQELRSELEALRHERPLAGLDHDLSKAMLPLDQPAAPPATVAPEPHPDLADLAPPAGESQP
jgi:sec-independent protein translocase protein TatB